MSDLNKSSRNESCQSPLPATGNWQLATQKPLLAYAPSTLTTFHLHPSPHRSK
jgi:hypothetical protein